jgi:hypothetical protein
VVDVMGHIATKAEEEDEESVVEGALSEASIAGEN